MYFFVQQFTMSDFTFSNENRTPRSRCAYEKYVQNHGEGRFYDLYGLGQFLNFLHLWNKTNAFSRHEHYEKRKRAYRTLFGELRLPS